MRISDLSSDVCSSDLAMMIADLVDAQADQLRVPFIELGLQACKLPQFGRADRRVILGVRKKHGPIGAEPLVETYPALGGFRFKVRCDVAKDRKSTRLNSSH